MSFDLAFDRLDAEWNAAEEAIKIAEQVNKEVAFPCIIELRYAGRKILEARRFHRSGDEDQAVQLLNDAFYDCRRARHDAVDAVTQGVLDALDDACAHLGAEQVLKLFPAASRLYKSISRAQGAIAESRRDRDRRNEIYTDLQKNDVTTIVTLYQEFKSTEEILIRASKRERIGKLINYLIGAIGAIVGVASLIVCIL